MNILDKKFRPITGLGDILLDIIYVNGVFAGCASGSSVWNLLANVSCNGVPSYAVGICGNDVQGKIAVDMLSSLNINVENIFKNDSVNTRKIFINLNTNSKNADPEYLGFCPKCKKPTYYSDSCTLPDVTGFIEKLPKGILVFDSLSEKNLIYASKIRRLGWKVATDIGLLSDIDNLNKQKLFELLNKKFDIIQLNEKVANKIKSILRIKEDIELFELIFPSDLLIITRASEGASIIWRDFGTKHKRIKANSKIKVVDPSGAGDAFFSGILTYYANENYYGKKITNKFINNSIHLSEITVNKALQCIGAIGHLTDLYTPGIVKQKDLSKKDKAS